MLSNKKTIEQTPNGKTNLNKTQQCFNFWMLSTVIRRGRINPKTNRRNKLSGDEMVSRINHYLLHFNWDEKMLEKIAELQKIAYDKLGVNHEANKTDNGIVWPTSE